jgi:hypothetical protein
VKRTETPQECLARFIEISDDLQSTSYVAHVRENKGINLHLDVKKSGAVVTGSNSPDRDKSKALILTARMFVQPRDGVSLDRIAEFAKSSDLSIEWKSLVNQICDNLNLFLNAETMVTINERKVIRREVLETFLYGHYAHKNPDKAEMFKSWEKKGFIFKYLEFEFHNSLTAIYSAVGKIARLSEMELNGEVPSLA